LLISQKKNQKWKYVLEMQFLEKIVLYAHIKNPKLRKGRKNIYNFLGLIDFFLRDI